MGAVTAGFSSVQATATREGVVPSDVIALTAAPLAEMPLPAKV
jgi:hypothetical protein